MSEAAVLEWCVPLVLAGLSGLFLSLGVSVRGAASWGVAYGLAAAGFAVAIVPGGSYRIAKAVTEDALLLFAVMAMARAISLRFARPVHDRAAIAGAAATLALTIVALVATRSVVVEAAIVQTACAGYVLFAAAQMWGRFHRPIDRVLFTLALTLAGSLLLQTAYVLAVRDTGLTLAGWRGTYWGFLFQLSGIGFGLAFAFTALTALGIDVIDGYRTKSEKDDLSGLYNRRGFESRVRDRLAKRPAGGALVVMDIDHFKAVNDTYGHAAGDMVIAGMGALLDTLDRATLDGRIGGEEFAVFIETHDRDLAGGHAAQIREALGRIEWPSPFKQLRVTASFGVAMARPRDDLDALYRRADDRLYQAKREGRDRIVTCDAQVISICEHQRSDPRSPPPPPSPATRDACAP